MSNTLPTIRSYGEYSSNNYGAHCLRVDLPNGTVWFSYQTPIAFQVNGHCRVVRENDWGPTTGKHLNWIDGGRKAERVSTERFEQLWGEQWEGKPAIHEPYQPKTGQACSCRPGVERDNCPQCEGTGMRIDFAAIRAR